MTLNIEYLTSKLLSCPPEYIVESEVKGWWAGMGGRGREK